MNRLFDLVPESNHDELERYLLELISEIRRRRNARNMHEVCCRRATEREAMNSACRRVAQLPDEKALSSLKLLFPNWADEWLVANLQLARKKLKRELHNRRDH
jgi:hypothetical protein